MKESVHTGQFLYVKHALQYVNGHAESVHFFIFLTFTFIQSTLAILKSKGPSETLQAIHTSTYQAFRIEENTNRTTKFHKRTCNLTPLVRNIHVC